MGKKLQLEIISPLGYLFEGSCHMAVIPGTQGEMGIMRDHELILTSLKQGKVKLLDEKENVIQEFPVTTGFAKTLKDKLLILIDD